LGSSYGRSKNVLSLRKLTLAAYRKVKAGQFMWWEPQKDLLPLIFRIIFVLRTNSLVPSRVTKNQTQVFCLRSVRRAILS